MWRERTSRTFFGESCSRETVDMNPLLQAQIGRNTGREDGTLALPEVESNPRGAGRRSASSLQRPSLAALGPVADAAFPRRVYCEDRAGTRASSRLAAVQRSLP